MTGAVSVRRGLVTAAALLLVACALGGVTVTPLRGPAPRSVLVLPPEDLTGVPMRNLRGVVFGADHAVQQRGYRALPLDIGFELAQRSGLVASGSPMAGDLLAVQRAADVDAVLAIEIAVWEADGERPLRAAAWDLTWRLVAVADGQELWRHRERGTWHLSPPEREDRTRAPDAEPETLPFGTLRPRDYRDAAELAAALHRAAMARLPERP